MDMTRQLYISAGLVNIKPKVKIMNVKDILSEGEQILFKAQQHRVVPGGKEVTPGQIFVTNERIILETSSMLGIKKDYIDLPYSDIMSLELKKNVFSSEIILQSRFQGEIHMKALGKKEAQEAEKLINERRSMGFSRPDNNNKRDR
jgi:hypothetical protein